MDDVLRNFRPVAVALLWECWRYGLGLRYLANYRNMIFHGAASTGEAKYRPYFENYTVDASILETAFSKTWACLGLVVELISS